jgi:PAS domain-containing protein
MYRTAKKHHWRVFTWMDFEDMIQEGYIAWYRVAQKYPHITQRAHIMRLFQITYLNRFNDLSKWRTRLPEFLACDINVTHGRRGLGPVTTELEIFDLLLAADLELGTIQTMFAAAPAPVKAAVKLFSCPIGCKKLRALYRRRVGGSRETFNQRLCRLTGYDPNQVDIPGLMLQHFSS